MDYLPQNFSISIYRKKINMAVNTRLLRLEIEKQSNVVFSKIKPQIQKKFNESKKQLLKNFDEHPVTIEIQNGPDASSEFVSTAAGGNLFSLIGFDAGDDPTEALREFLEEGITLEIGDYRKRVNNRGITWEVPVVIVTQEEIAEEVSSANPLEWTSKGWTMLIEKGIPWFAHYLFDNTRTFKNSHSGTAIQVKSSISEGRTTPFKGIPYISEILKKFKNSIK